MNKKYFVIEKQSKKIFLLTGIIVNDGNEKYLIRK
jgi:hypothetical protein